MLGSLHALPFLVGMAALLGLLPVLHSHGLEPQYMMATPPSQIYPKVVHGAVEEEITSSPPISQDSHPGTKHPTNNSFPGHGKKRKIFPVLDFNYNHVRKPFEIALWILLACLMKLGFSEMVLGLLDILKPGVQRTMSVWKRYAWQRVYGFEMFP
uniref:Uncharacterized protein n=1 Tax=Sphaerodactylus townsendi TaxID=933632 RepID=A0ACB8FRW4_9SAUR